MIKKYLTSDGTDLSAKENCDLLKLEHILQRYRDVWIPIHDFPFLIIDEERVREYQATVDEYAVFASGILFQNISREELGPRLIALMVGPGVTAGFSSSGNILVEGVANPQAYGFLKLQ